MCEKHYTFVQRDSVQYWAYEKKFREIMEND